MTDIITLDITDVYPDENNPRGVLVGIDALAANIAENGQLVPIKVRRDGDIYWIVSGERRYTAMKKLGLATVDAIIEDVDEATTAKHQVAENDQVPLTELERSRGIQTMLAVGVRPEAAAASAGESAERVGKAAKGLALAKDYAEDMTLDRLIAVAEVEDDPEAVGKLLTAYEKDWRRVFADITRERSLAAAIAEAEAVIAAAGVKLIEQNAAGSYAYLDSGSTAPDGAVAARVSVQRWAGSATVMWYGEQGAHDPQVAAEREQADTRRADLEAARTRRLAFVKAHLGMYPATSDFALMKVAEDMWTAGECDLSVEDIDEALAASRGFVATVYSALLSVLDDRACDAFTRSPYYVERHGQLTVGYFAALEHLGFEPTEAETAEIEWLRELGEEAAE